MRIMTCISSWMVYTGLHCYLIVRLCDWLSSCCGALQAYVVCELQDKLNILWAFIKAHLKVIFARYHRIWSRCLCRRGSDPCGNFCSAGYPAAQAKMLVFLTTGKQVKFALEAFRRLRPGVVLRSLHGKMKQMKRMAVYYDFCQVGRCYGAVLSSPHLRSAPVCVQAKFSGC
jgi:hypothetical protein